MADERRKLSPYQLDILIGEIEKDPTLMHGKVTGIVEKSEYLAKWNELAEKLNAVENGAVKSTSKWQQAWRDWKSNTKKKVAKVFTDNLNNGGECSQELTALERRVMSITENEQQESSGIDISSIDVDPLSSESEGEQAQSTCGNKVFGHSSYQTEYEAVIKIDKQSNLKRSQSEDRDLAYVKKRKLQMVSTETISRQNKEIMARLEALEKSQQDFQKHQTELLGAILSSLERQLAMESRLSDAVNRIADFIDNRIGPGG